MVVSLTPQEAEYATKVAHTRNENAVKAQADSHKYGFGGDNLEIHIEGALAEKAASKALNLQWDDGPWKRISTDVGPLQIRSTKLPYGKLIVRPSDSDNDIFILVIANHPHYDLKGFILGKDAKKDEWQKSPNGRPSAWFVPQTALQNIAKLRKTKNVLDEF